MRKKKSKKQGSTRAKSWIKFIVVEILIVVVLSYGFYENRKISIDECETFVTKIVDIKECNRTNAADMIYIQTNSTTFYIVCYGYSSDRFPVEEVLKEKELTLKVKKDIGIINLYYRDIREIVDMRSEDAVYVDFRAYNERAKIERICGYIIAPIFLLGVTFVAIIFFFDFNTIIKLIELTMNFPENKKDKKTKRI